MRTSIENRLRSSVSLLSIAVLGSTLCVLGSASASAAPLGLPLQQTELDVLARQFAEPLVPTVATSPADDAALVAAIKADRQSSNIDGTSALAAFAAGHLDSGWRPAVLTNLALGYEREGYYSRALDALEQAWAEGREARETFAKRLVDRAAGELLFLHAKLGHAERVEALVAAIGSRPLSGRAGELRDQAKEMVWRIKRDPNRVLRCGPNALEAFLRTRGAADTELAAVRAAKVGANGSTLAMLGELAGGTRFNSRIIHRDVGTAVPVPSVIHWKVGHFAAIVGKENGRYKVLDTVAGTSPILVSQQAIDAEASGYFLVGTDTATLGWQSASIDQASRIAGAGGVGASYNMGAITPNDVSAQNGSPGSPGGNCGMCGYSFTEMAVSLRLNDTPVGYAPPKGPPVWVSVTYNQREASQPSNMPFFNVSPRWTLNWLTYIQDDATPGQSVSRYVAGGGSVQYSGFNPGAGTFAPDFYDGSTLTYNSGFMPGYTRTMADGSSEVYGLVFDVPMSSTRYFFLTKKTDPAGNSLTLSYDGQYRLTTITDALGQKTTFSYGDVNFPLQVTKITDPFGRYASLQYDDNAGNNHGQLTQITDVLGLTSQFSYDSNSYVNALTTVYGTTSFTYGSEDGDGRYVTATDPLQNTERLEFLEGGGNGVSQMDGSIPPGLVNPDGNYQNDRDTFYWDKHAYAVGYSADQMGNTQQASYANARLRHWCHQTAGTYAGGMSNTLESEKQPLENKVWYSYPGQTAGDYSGTLITPTVISRYVGTGTPQVTQKTYDPVTLNLTSVTDPVLRTTTYNYYGNHIDLASVQQATSAGPVTIASFGTYNAQHRPSSYTDAAGQTTQLGYNSAGQLTKITDPLSEVTQFNYTGSGYLQKIINADNLTAAAFGYDGFGRVGSFTDSQGWTVNFGYDNLDRLRLETFPDRTTRSYNYTNLDLTSVTDRQNRTTQYGYNFDRYLTSITDNAGDTTQIVPYPNGVTNMLQDPDKGSHVTTWKIDIESRVTQKTYNNGATLGYAIQYEPTTSRPLTVTDARGVVKMFSYYADDRLAGIAYALPPNPNPPISMTSPVAFTYDPAFPRMTSMTDGNGTTTYGYYPTGMLGALHLASETPPFANSAIAYTYDALGRVSSRSVGGDAETMGYDKIGRLSAHVNDLGAFQLSYLGETGQLISRLSGLLGTDWAYQGNRNDRRLRSIVNTPGASRYQYATTPENDISAIAEDGGYQTWMYAYDGADRLTGATGSVAGAYGYGIDAASNLTTIQTPSGSTMIAPNALNQVAQYGQTSFGYDAAGNLTADYARTYTWDAENRLTGILYPGNAGASTVIAYDGMGRRTAIADTVGTTTTVTHFGWCGETLCQARTAADVPSKRYLAEGEEGTTGASQLIYGIDQLGSVRDAIGAQNGLRQRHYDYDPYGNLISTVGVPTVQTDMRYAGLFYHTLSGLYLATNRAFDPVTGRWISRDPIEESGGLNLYGYVGGNPLTLRDPWGLCSCDSPSLGLGAIIGGGIGGALGSAGGAVGGVLLGGTGGTFVAPVVGTIAGVGVGADVGYVAGGVAGATAGIYVGNQVENAIIHAMAKWRGDPDDEEGCPANNSPAPMKNSPAKGQLQNTPTPNTAQNKKSTDAANEAGLDEAQSDTLHDQISGKDYDYQTILDIANQIANGEF